MYENPNKDPNADTEAGTEDIGGPLHSHSNEERHVDEEFGLPAAAGGVEVGQSSKMESSSLAQNDKDGPGFFGPRRKRIMVFCFLLLWLCAFVIPRWSESDKAQELGDKWAHAYRLHLGGAAIIFIGACIELVVISFEDRVSCCENRLLKLLVTAILLLGGFLYWVGGIQLAKSINDVGTQQDQTHRYYLSGWAGTVFIEATFVALLVIVIGLDIVINLLSNGERLRIYILLNTILAFTAIVAFFSYTAWRGYATVSISNKLDLGYLMPSNTACVAAGWFFIIIACIYWYVFEFVEICCRCSASARACARDKTGMVKTVGIIIHLFGAFITMIGMWSIARSVDKKWNCYYVGYGFFIFFFSLIMCFDISFRSSS